MTTVFFLRHGPTLENKEKRVQGHQDGTLLTKETQDYITALIPLLEEKQPTALLCSDLERAVRTCHILKTKLKTISLKEVVDPLLREAGKGFYEGMAWEDMPPEIRAQRAQVTYDFRPFGGENSEDVRKRVIEMLHRLAQQYKNQRVVCVTHAGWIRQLMSLRDPSVASSLKVDRSAMYEVELDAEGKIQQLHIVPISE